MELSFSFSINEIATIRAAIRVILKAKPPELGEEGKGVKGLLSVLEKTSDDAIAAKPKERFNGPE